MKLGWTEAALMAGAKDVGLSPSIVGSLSRKEAALVEVRFLLYLICNASHHFYWKNQVLHRLKFDLTRVYRETPLTLQAGFVSMN